MDSSPVLTGQKKMWEISERQGAGAETRGRTNFECSEIQSDLMQEIHFGYGEFPSPVDLCNLLMTCLKNLGTLASRGSGHTAGP